MHLNQTGHTRREHPSFTRTRASQHEQRTVNVKNGLPLRGIQTDHHRMIGSDRIHHCENNLERRPAVARNKCETTRVILFGMIRLVK